MEEYKEVFENESRRELEKIDITSLFVDFCQGLRKLWWLILVLTVVFAIRGYFATSTSYVSQYVAEATVSVTFYRKFGRRYGTDFPIYSKQWSSRGCCGGGYGAYADPRNGQRGGG